MGFVYVVGFCTTDFPDGTTGSVSDAETALAAGWLPPPPCWAWAVERELARTNHPTDANRTHGNFFRSSFIRLSPWTQRTVPRRRYDWTLSVSRTFGGPANESCQAEHVTLRAPGQHPAVAAVKRRQRRMAILSQDHHAPGLPAAHRPYTRPSSVSVADVSVERGLRHRAQPASAVGALQPQESDRI